MSLCVLAGLWLFPLTSVGRQDQQLPFPDEPKNGEENRRLPNGKSWNIAVAKEEHERALKDADELLNLAQQLKSELQKSGDYVVSVSAVKKTEDIEKVARRIRGRLRG
jgi:hypothetical protein